MRPTPFEFRGADWRFEFELPGYVGIRLLWYLERFDYQWIEA